MNWAQVWTADNLRRLFVGELAQGEPGGLLLTVIIGVLVWFMAIASPDLTPSNVTDGQLALLGLGTALGQVVQAGVLVWARLRQEDVQALTGLATGFLVAVLAYVVLAVVSVLA